MVPVAPCPIKIEGINFVKGDGSHTMTKIKDGFASGGW
jgi:hypothetical protein